MCSGISSLKHSWGFCALKNNFFTHAHKVPQRQGLSGRIWVISTDISFPATAPGKQRQVVEPQRVSLTSAPRRCTGPAPRLNADVTPAGPVGGRGTSSKMLLLSSHGNFIKLCSFSQSVKCDSWFALFLTSQLRCFLPR